MKRQIFIGLLGAFILALLVLGIGLWCESSPYVGERYSRLANIGTWVGAVFTAVFMPITAWLLYETIRTQVESTDSIVNHQLNEYLVTRLSANSLDRKNLASEALANIIAFSNHKSFPDGVADCFIKQESCDILGSAKTGIEKNLATIENIYNLQFPKTGINLFRMVPQLMFDKVNAINILQTRYIGATNKLSIIDIDPILYSALEYEIKAEWPLLVLYDSFLRRYFERIIGFCTHSDLIRKFKHKSGLTDYGVSTYLLRCAIYEVNAFDGDTQTKEALRKKVRIAEAMLMPVLFFQKHEKDRHMSVEAYYEFVQPFYSRQKGENFDKDCDKVKNAVSHGDDFERFLAFIDKDSSR